MKKKHGHALQKDELSYKPKISEPARSHLLIQTVLVPVDFGEFSWFRHRKSRLDWRNQYKNLDYQPKPAWLGQFPLGQYLENQTGFPRDLPWKQSALGDSLSYRVLLTCLIGQHSRVFQRLERFHGRNDKQTPLLGPDAKIENLLQNQLPNRLGKLFLLNQHHSKMVILLALVC